MKNLVKTLATLAVGAVGGIVLVNLNVNKGDVIYEDDEKFIRAEKAVSENSSYAKVFYKNPN